MTIVWRYMARIPAAWMAVLMLVVTVSRQTAAADIPYGMNPAVIAKPGERTPVARINQWVLFSDNTGQYTGIKLTNTQGKHNYFDRVDLIIIANNGIFTAVVKSYDLAKGIIVAYKDGERYIIDAITFADTYQALKYLNEAYYSGKKADNLPAAR